MRSKNNNCMRAIWSFATVIALWGAGLNVACHAETAISALYDSENESVSVEVETDKKNRTAVLSVEKNGIFYVICEFERASKDVFECSAPLPVNCPSGRYTAQVTIGGEKAKTEFDHINKKVANAAMNTINSATKESFDVAISETHDQLAVDLDEYQKYRDKIKKIYFLHKPDMALTAAEFASEYGIALTLSIASGITDDEGLDAFIRSNATKIKFDYEVFNTLPSDQKSEIRERIRNISYTEKMLEDDYKTWFCLADINSKTDSSVKTYRETLFVTYEDILQLDLKDYNKSSRKEDIIRDIMKSEYNSIEELKNAFYSAVESNVETVSKGSYSGGGGSKSGSGGASYVGSPKTNVEMNVNSAPDTNVNVHRFSDVSDDFWGSVPINSLYELCIINGIEDDVFMPERNVTRAEFAKMLVNAASLNVDTEYEVGFSDVNENDWFYPFVAAAVREGVVLGYDDGTFRPALCINRQDMAVMIYRALKSKTDNHDVGSIGFNDESEISDYAYEAVSVLKAAGIVDGMDNGNYNPLDNVTRAQAAKAIYEFLQMK